MPLMNGYEAAREIRKLSASVPIVAMTADVIQGVREKCEQSGIRHLTLCAGAFYTDHKSHHLS